MHNLREQKKLSVRIVKSVFELNNKFSAQSNFSKLAAVLTMFA